MSAFYFLLLLLPAQEDQVFRCLNDVYKNLVVIRSIGNVRSSLNYLVDFKKNNNTQDQYLVNAIISDLDLISKAKPETQMKILGLVNDIFTGTMKAAANLDNNFYRPIEKKIELLESTLGKESFYVIYYKMRMLAYKCATAKDLFSYEEVYNAKEKIVEKFGKNSIFSAELYIACCVHNDRSKNWSELKTNSKKSLEIKIENGIDGYGLRSPVSYLIKSSVMLGQYKESVKYRDILKPFVLESLDIDTIMPQLRIFSSLATAYAKLDKLTNAIAMQEMAVAAACVQFNSDSPLAKEQAQVLRDLLAKNKEFTSMRNLEDRFKLQPLPLQKGEK